MVPLTKAVQELSALVEAQQQKIAQLENMVYGTGATSSPASTVGLKGETTLPEGFVLEQNIPNPFHRVTTISAMLPESVQKAKIIIYNLQGLELESYPLTGRGNTSVEISGGHFPSGMYLYTLIADDADYRYQKNDPHQVSYFIFTVFP